MQASFDRWVSRQDEATVVEVNGLSSWASLTFFIALFAVALDRAGGLIYAPAAIAVFLPALVNALGERLLVYRAGGKMTPAAWWCEIINVGALRFFCVGWMVHATSGTAAAAFSTLALIQGTYHGYFHRATLREPFVTLAGVAGALVGIAIAEPIPSYTHAALLVSLPAASIMELFAGHYGIMRDNERVQRDRLRDALEAGLLEDGMHLSATVEKLVATNHDVRNALTATLCELEVLVALTKDRTLPPRGVEMLVAAEESLREALAVSEAARKSSRQVAETRQRADLARVVTSTIEGARRRFPNVVIEIKLDTQDTVLVMGGIASARSIVENLVTNACEGDGRVVPTRVAARLERTGSTVVFSVEDNGPGFPADLLAGAVERIRTSKPNGTGIGLLTTERFVRASLGRIVRENRSQGGARVTVELAVGAP